MTIKIQKPIKFINECGCIVDFLELEQAILWYQSKPSLSVKKIYMHGRYPAVSIHEQKIHVHRLLMRYWTRDDIPKGYIVHHINGNKLDNRRENLQVISEVEHGSLHNKGKTLSVEHRAKISEAGRRRTGIKLKKRVNIPLDELKDYLKKGYSINKIAKIFKCDRSTIKSRIHEHPHLLEELGDG